MKLIKHLRFKKNSNLSFYLLNYLCLLKKTRKIIYLQRRKNSASRHFEEVENERAASMEEIERGYCLIVYQASDASRQVGRQQPMWRPHDFQT